MFSRHAANLNSTWSSVILAAILAFIFSPTTTLAQAPTPAAADTSVHDRSRPNSNPTQRVIIPRKDQSEQQQLSDQAECYDDVCAEIEWDPYQAYDALVDEGYAVALSWPEEQGKLVCLAARGAVTGVIAHELWDEPGADRQDAEASAAELGAAIAVATGIFHSTYLAETGDPAAERTIERFERNLRKWERKYAACLNRKGYQIPSD